MIRPYQALSIFRKCIYSLSIRHTMVRKCFSLSQWCAFVVESRFSLAHVLYIFFGRGSINASIPRCGWSAQHSRSLCLKMELSASDFHSIIPLTEEVQEPYAAWSSTINIVLVLKVFAYGPSTVSTGLVLIAGWTYFKTNCYIQQKLNAKTVDPRCFRRHK